MTHKDIFTKFMIEYDKANVTSSYPSLTEYEIATVLDKAYMALISLKVTGNNIRKAPFEADIKSVADLLPLVTTIDIEFLYDSDHNPLHNFVPHNVRISNLPPDMLYFVSAAVKYQQSLGYFINPSAAINNTQGDSGKAYDGVNERFVYANLVSHQIAQRFFATGNNIPWVKNPVCYIEDDKLYTVLDTELATSDEEDDVCLTYIKKPNTFVKDLDNLSKLLWTTCKLKWNMDDLTMYRFYDIVRSNNGSVQRDGIPYYYTIIPHLVANTSNHSFSFEENVYDITTHKEYGIASKSYVMDIMADADQYDEVTAELEEEISTILLQHPNVNFLIDINGSEYDQFINSQYYGDDFGNLYLCRYDSTAGHFSLFEVLYGEKQLNTEELENIVKNSLNISYFDCFASVPNEIPFSATFKLAWQQAITLDQYTIFSNLVRIPDIYTFELNDIAAEELISLAVTYALENVESLRLNTHLGVRGLEG